MYPKIAYTIENQLEAYSRAERHTERHEILWHAWKQNKIWLSQLLELTLPAFPAYSRHDESHAKSVIHNIERILGEDRIKQLSASDCFMLLHVAYVHDIGMCITADDRKKILQDDTFIEMVDRFMEEGDEDQQREARALLQTVYAEHEGISYKRRNEALKEKNEQKLQLYYAIIYLVSEYQRKKHGEESAERIHRWTQSPDQLGTGFSMSGIPLRLFLRIADCAVLHTDWDFSHVLDLPQQDSGYTHDMIHPRFVAVMLQLGDALDMDNDRFHLFTKPFVGQLPEMSELHFQKHQAIRQLKISPQEISIEADCTTQAALRQVRMECDGIESILKSASHHWSEISPKDLSGCLPTMRPLKIKLKGKAIPKELVSAKFDIEQKKAFQLMEGTNVYFGKLVFIRELLQNAIDATKIECWREYQRRQSHNFIGVDEPQEESFDEVIQKLRVTDYPICLSFKIIGRLKQNAKKKLSEDHEYLEEYVLLENLGNYAEADVDVGVLLTVKDFGTGISKNDLEQMTKVGSSYANKKRDVYLMPEWIQPTGRFGIGLQSVFQVCKSFTAYTRTHNDERHMIEFNSVVYQGGYINTTPVENKENEQYGTSFHVFVSCEHKLLHRQCMEAWNMDDVNTDRFSDDYEKNRRIRHSKELLTQMVVYLNSLINEPIFPICVNIDADGFDDDYLNFIKKRADKLCFNSRIHKISIADLEKKISWIYHVKNNKSNSLIVENLEHGVCVLDYNTAKLHIWDSKSNISAQLGSERLRKREKKTKLYIKGIYLAEYNLENDLELLESIDINSHLPKHYININRNELTDEGLEYVKRIYEVIMVSIKQALDSFAYKEIKVGKEQTVDEKESFVGLNDLISESVSNQIKVYVNQKEKAEGLNPGLQTSEKFKKLCENILFASCLSMDALIKKEQMQKFVTKKQNVKDNNCWSELLKKIDEVIESNYNVFAQSMLKKIPVFEEELLNRQYKSSTEARSRNYEHEFTFPGLMRREKKIGIISKRAGKYSFWTHYVIVFKEETYGQLTKAVHRIDDWQAERMEWESIGELILTKFNAFYEQENSESKVKKYDPDIQYLLKWMLTNIPTHGIWSTEDGNTRLNVLSRTLPNSIYYNDNMKYLMLESINERYERYGGKRYLTVTWKGYEALSLERIPSSVCFVSRGYLNKNQKSQMLLPIDADYIGELLSIYDENDFSVLIQIVKKYQEYFQVRESITRVVDKLFDRMIRVRTDEFEYDPVLYEYMYRKNDKEPISLKEKRVIAEQILDSFIRERKQRSALWKNTSCSCENDLKDLNKYLEDMPKKEDVHIMAVKIYYGDDYDEDLLLKTIKIENDIRNNLIYYHKKMLEKDKIKEEIMGSPAEKQNMFNYISCHNYYGLKDRDVEKYYESMVNEILDIIYHHMIRKVIENNKIKDKVQFIAGKLILEDV